MKTLEKPRYVHRIGNQSPMYSSRFMSQAKAISSIHDSPNPLMSVFPTYTNNQVPGDNPDHPTTFSKELLTTLFVFFYVFIFAPCQPVNDNPTHIIM